LCPSAFSRPEFTCPGRGKPYARGYWQAARDRYTHRFRDFADGIVAPA
jgi:hypothetical protein